LKRGWGKLLQEENMTLRAVKERNGRTKEERMTIPIDWSIKHNGAPT